MQAATYTAYGPAENVSVTEIEKPVPKENDVLIRVHASTVSSGDWRLRSLAAPKGMKLMMRLFAGVFGPRQQVLGSDVSGVIVEIGNNVSNWQIGDVVIGFPDMKLGGHAEYLAMPANGVLAHKPANLSFAEAAAIPFGGLTALCFLRDKAALKPNEKILIIGASGATGSAAVQIARHFGAHVTGVCSGRNVELVRDLGAHEVIDYQGHDFTKTHLKYDIILDTTATAPWRRIKHMLTPKGRLVVISGGLKELLGMIFNRRIIGGVSSSTAKDLQFLLTLIQRAEYFPLIDRVYPLNHIVKAHAHVETGHKKGAVVLSLLPELAQNSNQKEQEK